MLPKVIKQATGKPEASQQLRVYLQTQLYSAFLHGLGVPSSEPMTFL